MFSNLILTSTTQITTAAKAIVFGNEGACRIHSHMYIHTLSNHKQGGGGGRRGIKKILYCERLSFHPKGLSEHVLYQLKFLLSKTCWRLLLGPAAQNINYRFLIVAFQCVGNNSRPGQSVFSSVHRNMGVWLQRYTLNLVALGDECIYQLT